MTFEYEKVYRIDRNGGKHFFFLQPPSTNFFHVLQVDHTRSSSVGLQQMTLFKMNLQIIFLINLLDLCRKKNI